MVPDSSPTKDSVERAALIHREIFQLSALILVAIGAFVLTRTVAASNRQTNLHDASEWYRRGQQAIASGQLDDAVDSLRRATVRDHSDRRYVLALAQALALRRDGDEARSVLLTLRESAPEDPDINLQLARLAAARQDATEVLRFYHNALYAPWPTEQADARRGVRLELIRFLLTHNQVSRALPELLALSTDLPDNVALRLEVAQAFATSGDYSHALDQFQRTLSVAPENDDALAGAGEAAFQLGEYVLAQTYLRRVTAETDEVRNTGELVDLVLSHDPLAKRIGSAERRRRLVADFSYARQRLAVCLEQRPDATGDQLALQHEAQVFGDQLRPRGLLEQDTVETGVDLVERLERLVAERCGSSTALDRALVLVVHQHGRN